jgi:hypothetical protein
MEREAMKQVVDTAFNEASRVAKMASLALRTFDTLGDEFADAFESFSVYSWGLYLTLKETTPAEQQATIHRIMRRLGLKEGRKQKNSWEKTLSIRFDEAPFSSEITLFLQGYQPPSCHVVKKTRIIPARPAEPEREEEYESLECETTELEGSEVEA